MKSEKLQKMQNALVKQEPKLSKTNPDHLIVKKSNARPLPSKVQYSMFHKLFSYDDPTRN